MVFGHLVLKEAVTSEKKKKKIPAYQPLPQNPLHCGKKPSMILIRCNFEGKEIRGGISSCPTLEKLGRYGKLSNILESDFYITIFSIQQCTW